MANTSVVAIVAADASIGPQVAAAGYSILLRDKTEALKVHILGSEAIPTGLSVAESELLALIRGQHVLNKLFCSIPRRLKLEHLLLVTDNEETWRACVYGKHRSPGMESLLTELTSMYYHVQTDLVLMNDVERQRVKDGEVSPEAMHMLDEAHGQARAYKRQLGSILDE